MAAVMAGAACERPSGGGADAARPNAQEGGVHDAVGPGRDAAALALDLARPPGATRLRVRVRDADSGEPLPAIVALFHDDTGRMLHFGRVVDVAALGMGQTLVSVGPNETPLSWQGLVLWRGEEIIDVGVDLIPAFDQVVDRGIPYGRYRLVAHRGPEYDLTEGLVELPPDVGDVTVDLPLSRVVDTRGYAAVDLHVHSKPSGDSHITVADRAKWMAAAGLDGYVATEHDLAVDPAPTIAALWPGSGTAPVAGFAGSETSGLNAHFVVFPAAYDPNAPRGGAPEPNFQGPSRDFFQMLHALPSAPVVIAAHPRLGWASYFADHLLCGGFRDHTRLPPCSVDFDGIELLNGFLACGTKIDETLADWYALLDLGRRVTATAGSDSHGASLLLGGSPRTYVRVSDDRAAALTGAQIADAVRRQAGLVTTGPFLTVRTSEGRGEGEIATATDGAIKISVRMQAASWVRVDEVRLLVNGAPAVSWTVPRVGQATPLFEAQDHAVPITRDSFITVEARAAAALPSFLVGEWVETARITDESSPFSCPASPAGTPVGAALPQGMLPFAVTNPLFVDADGDGTFSR